MADRVSFNDFSIDLKKVFEYLKVDLQHLNINLDSSRTSFDGIYCMKVAASNILGESGKQTHIAITSNTMDLFPYMENYQYLLTQQINSDYKRHFILRLPVILIENNITYLNGRSSQEWNSNDAISTYTHTARSRRADGSIQTELSYITLDGEEFINFRKIWRPGDYLYILKRYGKLEYLCLVLREDFGSLKTGLFLEPKSITPVGEESIPPSKDVTTRLDELKEKKSSEIGYKRNRIIYGAPGTGKSYELNEQTKHKDKKVFEFVKRVTFHPEYTYSQFVGSYKPTPIYMATTDETNSNIKYYEPDKVTEIESPAQPVIDYRLVCGPFLEILIEALKYPQNNYLLIIEEINRANVAAVFGDVFQLLDRTKTGESEYSITFNKDIMHYLKSKLKEKCPNEIRIPSNMYIWATMNSADQGVAKMDSAFKRRWSFDYIGINDKQDKVSDSVITLSFLDKPISWNDFRHTINEWLQNGRNIPEDKLIGPFFMKEDELVDSSAIKNKLLLYLRDDVLRHDPSALFINESFSRIMESYNKGEEIFIPEVSKILHNFESNQSQDESVTENDIKVGKLVQSVMNYIEQENLLDIEKIRDLLDAKHCNETFKLNYPLFKEINSTDSIDEQRKDDKGQIRYYKKIYKFNEHEYLLTKEWYEKRKSYFEEWVSSTLFLDLNQFKEE